MASTVYTGMENSYTGAVTVVRQLEDYIDNFTNKEFPLLQRVGLNSYNVPVQNTKVEWQSDSFIPIQDALDGAVGTAGATSITVDHAEYFALHDVVRVDSELMQVVAIDASSDTLTVARGFAGSTAATHSDNAIVYRLGSARPEGSSPGWTQQTAVTQPYNYTQIWDAAVSITGTEEALKNYAPADLLAMRLDKRMTELYQMMEQALLYSNKRYQGSATAGRVSGGADFFVADKNNIGGALAYSDIVDAMSDKFAAWGQAWAPDTLVVNASAKQVISGFGASIIRTARTENTYGYTVDAIETDFGTVEVMLDHLVMQSDAWLLRMDSIQIAPLEGRSFKEYDASVPGDDATRHRVLGEYVFIFKGEDGTNDGLNAKLYGITYS